MCFNAHSLLLCVLFAYNHMAIMRFSACNGFIDTFRVTPGKWLELAYIVLICGLFDGIGAAGGKGVCR